MGFRSTLPGSSLLLLSTLVAGVMLSCASDFDSTRQVGPSETLGEQMFTVLCDRVGASSLTEDISGASYHSICHKGSKGWVGTTVNEKVLPPASKAPEARRLSIAKVESMAQSRERLIEAFDTIFPDEEIVDPLDSKKKIRLYQALDLMVKRFTPLYESSPYSTKDQVESPLMPATTQAFGALMGALASSKEGRDALSRMSGRDGYRPLSRTLGTIRSLLAYPELRRFLRVMLDRTGPGGPLEGKFQHLLRVIEQELKVLEPDPKEAPISVDETKVQPNRSRFKMEILGALLLSEHNDYSRGGKPTPLVTRDLRGFAAPRGWVAGKGISIPAPFVDKNSDGFADVDLLGRFLGSDGEPLWLSPFSTPSVLSSPDYSFDASGRALSQGKLLFDYRDVSSTFLSSLLDDLRPLLAMDEQGQSTMMKALEGSYLLYGAKKQLTAEYGEGSAKVTIPYQAFDTSVSPFLDLTYATGQFFGAPESDDYLGSILDIHEKYPEKTARALQLAWAIWDKSKSPEYAQAVLADTSTFWEELTDWLVKVVRVGPSSFIGKPGKTPPRGLFQDLMLALVHPDALQYLPGAFAAPMRFTDRIGYNPYNVNGPPINKTNNFEITEGTAAFKRKVKRELPDQGDNRSAFQRFAHVIAASNHVNACNRQGSKVNSTLKICGVTIGLSYPLGNGTLDECDLINLQDLGIFFVDSSLDWDHPRRARLKIEDETLNGILGVVSKLVPSSCGSVDMDSVLQSSSGLEGLTTTPSSRALMRLVFFGASGSVVNKPDYLDPLIDGQNSQLNAFISGTLDPVGTTVCPQDGKGVNICDSYEKTLRGVEPDTFFVAETPYLAKHPPGCLSHCANASGKSKELCETECNGPSSGFFEGLRPTLTTFANYAYLPPKGDLCTPDSDLQGRCHGEQLFLDLMSILDKHWSSGGSSLFRYEDLLAWVLADSDLFGTASDLVTTMDTFEYVSPRVKKGPRSPLEITAHMIQFLFDPQIAASLGMVDQEGSKSTLTNNGKIKAQLTPYDLFVQALRNFDKRFDAYGDPQKKVRWKEARSSLVDQFLLADNSTWKNSSISRALPIAGRLLREQINVNCSGRESSKQCDWARDELTKKLKTVIEGPLFSAINDMNEALREDNEMRVELGRLLNYLLDPKTDSDSFALTLTSLADLIQVVNDESEIVPALRTFSSAATPGGVEGKDGKLVSTDHPGTTTVFLKYMKVLMDEPEDPEKWIDRYHAMDGVLKRLVTPISEGKQSPLEVILDSISEVQRIDSSQQGAFTPEDYQSLGEGLRFFLTDEYRGMEQFYTIVRGRNGD